MSLSLLLFPVLAYSRSILLVRNEATPESVLSLFSPSQVSALFPSISSAVVVAANDLQALTTAAGAVSAVVDLCERDFEVEVVASVCESLEVPHFVVARVGEIKSHRWTYYIRGKFSDVISAIEAVVSSFGWTSLNVVSDSTLSSSSLVSAFKQSTSLACDYLSFPLTDSRSIERTVGKEMRMTGNRISVFFSAPALTREILTTQYSKKIGDAGFGDILLLDSSLFAATGAPTVETGSLIVAEAELATASTEAELYQSLIAPIAEAVAAAVDSQSLLQVLGERFPGHSRSGPFVLLNLQKSVRVGVGEVRNAQYQQTATVYFLGNTTEVPRNAKSPLLISGNFGVWNVATMSTTVHNYYRGAMMAVEEINTWDNILEHFSLELFNFTAGVSVWNYDFAYKNVHPQREKLGLAAFAGTSSGVTVKLIPFLQTLNFSGPIIGSSNTVNSLSSRSAYPMYIRTVVADSFITGVYLQMFKLFGWKRCGLFVSNETWGLGFRDAFSALAESNGIEILNNYTLQVVPSPIPSLDFLRNYTANLLDFIDTKARVLIIVVNNNAQMIIDLLYELGIRGGEVQIVANEWMGMGFISTNDTEVNRKRCELLRGAIQFTPVGFLGDFGSAVYNRYIARYGIAPQAFSGFFYDSALALAYALDLVLRAGDDYTDPSTLMKALRGSRFVGSTGAVTFSADSNDRAPMPYAILNARFDGNDSFVTNFTSVGMYDPASTQLFSFQQTVEWCDGSSTVPEDLRKSTVGCPFEDKFTQKFYQGWYLLYGLCAGVAVLVSALTSCIWRKWWNRPLAVLTERRELQLADVMLMFGIFFELVQYVSFGPSLTFVSQAASSLMSTTTLEVQDFLSFKDGGFSILWTAVCSTVVGWFVMCALVLCHCEQRLEWVPCCHFLTSVSEAAIPFIGNLLFLPIASVLLEVYVCTEAVGTSEEALSFKDSYLLADCYMKCWQDKHAGYAAASAVLLAGYFPAAVVLRPLWQELQEQLNIKTFPLFLMVKTVVQTCVILLNKTAKRSSPVAHAVIFLAVMGGFLLFSVRFTSFGYRRTQLWHVLSLCAVLWSSLLALIHQWSGTSSFAVFLGLMLTGWCGLALFGVVYQVRKVPNLLYRKKGLDVSNLYRFAFRRATVEILSDLRDNFKRVGHRNNVVLPSPQGGETMTTEAAKY